MAQQSWAMTPDTGSGDLNPEPAQRCFFQWDPQGRSPPALPTQRWLHPPCAAPPGHAVGEDERWGQKDVTSPLASCFLSLALIFVVSTLRLVFFRDAGRVTEVETKCPSIPACWSQYSLQPHPPFSSMTFLRMMLPVNLTTTSTSPLLFALQRKTKPKSYTNNKTLDLVLVLALSSLSATATKKMRSKVLLLGIIMYLELWSYSTVSHTCKPVTLPKLFLLSPLLSCSFVPQDVKKISARASPAVNVPQRLICREGQEERRGTLLDWRCTGNTNQHRTEVCKVSL